MIMSIHSIDNEKGLTLVELIVVIAVLSVVTVMMTSLLLIPTKIANTLKFEGTGENTATLINSHVTQSLRKNGHKDCVSLIDEAGYKNVLKIDRIIKTDGDFLFYFYDASKTAFYFQTGDKFEPDNIEESMLISDQVKNVMFVLSADKKELRISIDAYADIDDDTNLTNTKFVVALKAN